MNKNMDLSLNEIIDAANAWLNRPIEKNEFNQHMIGEEFQVIENSIKEYNHCYIFGWEIKKEAHLPCHKRTPICGVGRLLISKDGQMIQFEGSNIDVDWVHWFELEFLNLDEYWVLEISYEKKYVSILKVFLECSTSDLLEKVNSASKIVLEYRIESWSDYHPFQSLIKNLETVGISYQLFSEQREKLA
ncbi:MAG: hypothetical protein MK212_03290 [Saprospiraceae bacterium]|nr:hypothetical protein [Saprospiraceae bacterium]